MLGPTPPGLFVYPMDENTTVVGFEAVIADRVVTIQIKDKAKLDRSHLDIQSATVTGKETHQDHGVTPEPQAHGKAGWDMLEGAELQLGILR